MSAFLVLALCLQAQLPSKPTHNRSWAQVSGPANDIRFEALTKADGIPSQEIYQVLQGHRGFLWFTTDAGLIRYDGYQSVVYPGLPMARRQQFADAVPGLLFEDTNGRLWVASHILTGFDPATGKFETVLNPRPGEARPGIDAITAIHEGPGNTLWVGISSQAGKEQPNPALYEVDPIRRVSVPHPIGREITRGEPVSIRAIEEDARGRIWLGSSIGLIRFDPATASFRSYEHTHPDTAIDQHVWFNAIVSDKSGHLWIHVPAGLERFDPETGVFDRFSAVQFRYMFADPGGRIWLWGSNMGVLEFDPSATAESALRTITLTSPSGQPLHDELLLAGVNSDRQGRIWIFPTSGGTAYRYSPDLARLSRYTPAPASSKGLSGGDVWRFLEDDGGFMWIATHFSGLNRFDPRSGTFTQFRHDPRNPRSLISDRIEHIAEDRDHLLWVATDQGFGTFDRKTGTYTHLRGVLSAAGTETTGMLVDRSGRVVVSTANSVEVVDKRTGALTRLSTTGGFLRYEDCQGNLWLTVRGGLRKLDRTGMVRHIPLREPDAANPSLAVAGSFHEDPNGTLWVSTNKGLYEFEPGSERAVRYAMSEGLSIENVKCMVAGDDRSFWLSTTQGISRFDRLTRRFENYDEKNGIQGRDFLWASCYKARDGMLYFGGSGGFHAFHPGDLLTRTTEPSVSLTGFQINGQEAPVIDVDSIQLGYRQNGLTFEFASLGAEMPGAVRYRFRLENLENNWIEADSMRRIARYTDVPPGKYVFRAEASMDGKSWSRRGVALPVRILPPWWRTWWARAIWAMLLIGSVLAAHRLRVGVLHRRQEELAGLVERRTAELVESRNQAEAANQAKSVFLAKMSHELRTPLNAIIGFSHLLRQGKTSKEQREQLEIISRSGEHLLTLIDDVLDVAKIEAGRQELRITACDLMSLVRDVTDMIRVKAQAKNLRLHCDPPPDFPRYVRVDSPKLRQVLINLLGNAVRYTESGAVTLGLRSTAVGNGRVRLRFEVQDTGAGISPEDQRSVFEPFVQATREPAAEKGAGLGLTIARQYVGMMGGTLELQSEPGRGSRFTVELQAELALESEVSEVAAASGSPGYVLEPGQPEFRVLIVEDNPENAAVLQRLLDLAGFQVRVALDGALGIEQFRQWRPHFIWMDLRMPGMGGEEVARRIRAMDGGAEVKIAAMSASVFTFERDGVLASGINDFVSKPYRPKEVFDCLARHLGVRYRVIQESVETPPDVRPLQPHLLAALPQELRHHLKEAILSLDRKRIEESIERVRECNEELASALRLMSGNLAYTAILKALNDSEPVSTPAASASGAEGQRTEV